MVRFGKNILLPIFSVFVIFIIIVSHYNYKYNTLIASNYKNYYFGSDSKKEQQFYDDVAEIYLEYKNVGSTIDMNLFLATVVISETRADIEITDMSKTDIHTIFKCMNSDPDIEDYSRIIYEEEAFRKNIKEKWLTTGNFKKVTKNYNDEQLDGIVDEIFIQMQLYEQLYGEEEINNNLSSGGVCSYKVGNNSYSNIKVKLLNCEGNTYVEGEELVDFETYITGVVYQEIGNTEMESMKAQAVAARSYALKRPSAMNGAFGIKFGSEDGATTLSLRSCTLDQVFCHPDKGCWSNTTGGQTGSSSTWPSCTVHSGEDKSKTWSKSKLDDNSNIRKAVQETSGQVAVDSEGKVVYTSYLDTNQKRWTSMAKQGSDYFEILKKDYPSISSIKADCTSGANTELAKQAVTWKQYDSKWGSQYIGDNTIKQVGCMVTATSIQIARSGTELKVNNFDPGVFVSTVKSKGGFSGNNFNVDDSTWSSIAPNFKTAGMIDFTDNDTLNQKKDKVADLISKGYYVIARIHHPGEHWVAITDVQNGKVTMADPGSDSTDFCGKYNCEGVTSDGKVRFGRIYYFKAN